MPTRALFPLALAAAMTVSGCVGGNPSVFAGPANVPLDAPHETGNGAFAVKVRVIAEGVDASPIPGAAIVIHEIQNPVAAPSVQELLRRNATLGGRTDAEGVLRAHLDAGKTYTFLAAASNWTTEARHLVKITSELRDQPLTIALFKTGATLEHKGKVPLTLRPDTPFLNLGTHNAKWWPIEVRFHEDNESQRQYMHRLHAFEATQTVTSPPGTVSNIHLRAVLSSDGGQPFVYEQRAAVLSPGAPNVKRIVLAAPDLANIAKMKNPVLRIGPMTFESAVGVECIPWDLQIVVGFDTAPRPTPRRLYQYAYGADPGLPQPPANC